MNFPLKNNSNITFTKRFNGETFYLLKTGSFPNRKKAEMLKKQLKDSYGNGKYVHVRIVKSSLSKQYYIYINKQKDILIKVI